jgi:hypothetical protein
MTVYHTSIEHKYLTTNPKFVYANRRPSRKRQQLNKTRHKTNNMLVPSTQNKQNMMSLKKDLSLPFLVCDSWLQMLGEM